MELIFVHGALVRDGRWWWESSARLIGETLGIESRAVELPSCGESSAGVPIGGLVEDASALRRELDQVESAIVVGHSYGGTVIAEAGAHPAVAHLIYVSSYLPIVGQSQADIMSGERDPVPVRANTDGTVSVRGVDAEAFGRRFLHDADAGVQGHAWERVTAQSVESFTTPTSAAGWQGVPSTYVVCLQDRSTSVTLQREHAARATQVVECDTGHHPFISQPQLMADHVALAASRA